MFVSCPEIKVLYVNVIQLSYCVYVSYLWQEKYSNNWQRKDSSNSATLIFIHSLNQTTWTLAILVLSVGENRAVKLILF